jgi:hypothetical protein
MAFSDARNERDMAAARGGMQRSGGGTGNWGRGGVGGGYGGYRPAIFNPPMMPPKPMAPAQAPAMQSPMINRQTMQSAMLSIPGGSAYGLQLPSYGYFGTPGLKRPLMMGGI